MHETQDGLVLSECEFCEGEICDHQHSSRLGKTERDDHKIRPFLDSRTGVLSRDIEKGKGQLERLEHDLCASVGCSAMVMIARQRKIVIRMAKERKHERDITQAEIIETQRERTYQDIFPHPKHFFSDLTELYIRRPDLPDSIVWDTRASQGTAYYLVTETYSCEHKILG